MAYHPKNITAQRFGRLVALRPTNQRRRGLVVWECRCDCGNTTYVTATDLIRGNTSSCGCLRSELVSKDITGKRFGKLIALWPIPERDIHGQILWECKCDCSNIIFTTTQSLLSGKKTSCGCSRENNEFNKLLDKLSGNTNRYKRDLTNQRFGRLIALEPTPERQNHSVVWKCLCDCGNTVFVSVSKLTSGNTQSCGCLQKDSTRKNLTGQRFGKLIALNPTSLRDTSGSVIWRCACDCGNTAFASVITLCGGNVKSCGCLKTPYK